MFVLEIKEYQEDIKKSHKDYRIIKILREIKREKEYIVNGYKAIEIFKNLFLYPSTPFLVYGNLRNFYGNLEDSLISHNLSFLQGLDNLSFIAGTTLALAGSIPYFIFQLDLTLAKKRLRKSEKSLENII